MLGGTPYFWLACAVALLIGASVAVAGEITRDQYVERAEGICRQSSDGANKFLKEAKSNMQRNKVGISGRQFIHASNIISGWGKHIEAIPKPAEDATVLTTWLERLETENLLLEKVGKALVSGHRVKAQGYLARFVHSGNRANNLVFGFGFDDCLFKVSRVT